MGRRSERTRRRLERMPSDWTPTQRVIALLEQEGVTDVTQLAVLLDVREATIRRAWARMRQAEKS